MHSFNALLKTLEEPPEHVKFLLATTDPQKLPVTILSRCLQFHLKALDVTQISEQLEVILNAENIEVCIDNKDENNLFAAAYDIVDQTNWRKIAISAKYEKQSRKVKSISFNRENEADILHFVENQKDFSNWVKNKILEEINKSHK